MIQGRLPISKNGTFNGVLGQMTQNLVGFIYTCYFGDFMRQTIHIAKPISLVFQFKMLIKRSDNIYNKL